MPVRARFKAFLGRFGNSNSNGDGSIPTNTFPQHQQRPAGTNLQYHKVDPDGDVIFALDDGVTIRVSSKVLRIGSGYFQTLLFGWSREAQVERSDDNPQTIELKDVDSHAAHRLCCLLHHQLDPEPFPSLFELHGTRLQQEIEPAARRLQDLAGLIDRFDCLQALGKIADSLLYDFMVPCVRDAISFQATVDLASAAYLLRSSRFFRLFTKRLLTDHTESLQDMQLPAWLPNAVERELLKQSRQAWEILNNNLEQLSRSECTAALGPCLSGGADRLFVDKLTDYILRPQGPRTVWPGHRDAGTPLRHLLVGIYHLERMQRVAWCDQHKVHTYGTVAHKDFKFLCQTIDSVNAIGLCLACTRKAGAADSQTIDCRCAMKSATYPNDMRWVRGDSFLLGTGAADRNKPIVSRSRVAAMWEAIS